MSIWYSYDRMLSYNCFVNFVMSNRGSGKTYGCKDRMIKNFLTKGTQSVYVRRTQVEMDNVVSTFFADIIEKYPDCKFDVIGDEGYINGKLAIHFIPLSKSLQYKSKPFPLVKEIYFDEYVIPIGATTRYLKNEMFLFHELIETIFRKRDDNDMRIVLMANAISYVNPFFSYYNIEPESEKRFQRFHNKMICLELFTSDEFIKEKKNTKFGKLIEGTQYADYAIGNVAYEDNDDYIMRKRIGTRWEYIATLKTGTTTLSVWGDLALGVYHIDDTVHLESTTHNYVMTNEDNAEGYKHIASGRSNWRIKSIKKAYIDGKVFYKNQEVKRHFNTLIIRYL